MNGQLAYHNLKFLQNNIETNYINYCILGTHIYLLLINRPNNITLG